MIESKETRPARAERIDSKILRLDVSVEFFGFGQNCDGDDRPY